MVEKKVANRVDKQTKLLLSSKKIVTILLINQKYEATLCR